VKGYVIANPHNPTGKVYEDSEIIELCEWAKDHGDFNLVFDEIYNHSVLNGQQHAVTAV
jgi:aspartate/methionine/tyrosine aminotransferase